MPLPERELQALLAQWIEKAEQEVRVVKYLMEQPQGFANPICFHA